MCKQLFLPLLLCLALPVTADMHIWQAGRELMSLPVSDNDSVTFVSDSEVHFTVFRLSDTQLSVTPSDTSVFYIWVATSDADYNAYAYNSYQEAWQTTVDMAVRYDFLETDMLSKGRVVIDLTTLFDPDHYVLSVAAWDGTRASSAFTYYDFTLTEEEQKNTSDIVPLSMLQDNGCTGLLATWHRGRPQDTVVIAAIDSMTFSEQASGTTFRVNVSDITNISVAVDIQPSNDEAAYFADYILCTDADQYADTVLARLWIEQCVRYLPYDYPGKTFEEAYLYKGAQHIVFSEGLVGDTDYYIVCFAVNTMTCAVEGRVVKKCFHTAFTPVNPNLTFDINYNTDTYMVTITPSDDTSTYYWGFFSPDEVIKAGSAEKAWQQAAVQYGNKYTTHGVQSFSAKWQAVSTGTYTLVVGGWNSRQTTNLTVYEIEVTEDMLP